MTDKFRTSPPDNIPEGMANLVRVWQEVALASAHIAASKQAMHLAYMAEGFSEAQALELVKSP